jgi:NADH-quinone oxidoreductase subunit L
VTLALLAAAAPKGPLDTWSPTLIALFALLLPLIALLIILAFTIDSRRLSLFIAVVFTLGAAICALLVVAIELAHPLHLERNATFLQFFTGQSGAAAEFVLQWGVVADPLAAVMLVAVTIASLFVQIFGLSSIRREDGPIRFFCVLLFATFAMIGVVLATTYFEMLFFFGLVSLSTYLMIGHWWQRQESISAAALAFFISVAGDIALLAATAYVYFRFNELNFQTLAGQYTGGKVSANGLFIMSALVFIAAAAKSAEFPLHVWLPASAQAPAPAAALLHSAGGALVGVYLIARTYALFHSSPRALALLAIVGGVTALLGVTFALCQGNLKRAIAYTTMGELGLMVLALGISAYGAAIFEAFAQAWPKALLFLAAGVVIREMRTERLTEMGGLWRRMPFTGWVSLIAVLAIAGVPPFSTFWSKDTILSKALAINSVPAVIVVVAVTVIGAMAVGRIFCLVFTGETARRRRFEPERIRDAGGRAAFAMVLLAIPSVVAGIRGIRGRTDPIAFVTFPRIPLANSHLTAAGIIAVAALVGVAVAWLIYGRRLAVPGLQPESAVLGEGLYVGRGYAIAGSRLLLPATAGLDWADERLVDGAGDLVADSLTYAGRPRRWLLDLPLRQLAIAVLAGALVLALATILLAGRLFGATG